MTRHLRTPVAIAALTIAAVAAQPAAADDVADFYKGKQINFVVGYSAGGGYDTYTRLLANVIGKHIPGNPDAVVTYMPGGGSMKAANYTYNVAPKDGSYVGVFSAPVAIEPLLGTANAKFDTLKFGWLGNMFKDTYGCVVWHAAKVKTLQDVIDAKEPVVFGATSVSSYGNQHARVLRELLGANIKIVTGYRGVKDVGKALEQGEVTGACAMAVSTVKSAFRSFKDSGKFRMIVQFGREKHPYMDDATMFYSLLKNKDQERVADFFFSQAEIARPAAAPPGLPAARLAALRKAFAESLKDPALQARAAQIGIDVIFQSPETVMAAFKGIYATPPAVIARAKEIMGRKK